MADNIHFGPSWLENARNAVDSTINEIVHGLFPPQTQHTAQRRSRAPDRAPFPTGQFFMPQGASQAQPAPPQNQGAPPASRRAIQQLPTIRVSPEDLVEPSNRECCICLEENCLDDKVTRLPCAHIFHEDCIVDWLTNHHCTCPVCRYELATENPLYEAGRLERMKTRKPRYAMYELKRMSIPELLELNRRPVPGVCEKEELIQILVRDERIDLVPAPKPVEYPLETLKGMKIRELKRVMEDAGVFFHAKDVVEKSDMLTIFLNSGRLCLLPVEEESEANNDSSKNSLEPEIPGTTSSSEDGERRNLAAKRPFVETVDSDDECDIESPQSLPPPQEMFSVDRGSGLASREVGVDADDKNENDPANRSKMDLDRQDTQEESTIERIDKGWHERDGSTPRNEVVDTLDTERVTDARIENVDDSIHDSEAEMMTSAVPPESPMTTASDAALPPPAMNFGSRESSSHISLGSERSSADSQYKIQEECRFQEYTIAHLQELARINKVNVSSCFERREMVNLLVNAGVTMKHPSELFRENLAQFSVSELRALASEVNIDLSQCNDKKDMLHCIVQEAMERPHLQNYLRALSPLATLSLNELRRTAREWGVNINDCLEKGEIITRLITRGHRFGSC